MSNAHDLEVKKNKFIIKVLKNTLKEKIYIIRVRIIHVCPSGTTCLPVDC